MDAVYVPAVGSERVPDVASPVSVMPKLPASTPLTLLLLSSRRSIVSVEVCPAWSVSGLAETDELVASTPPL